MRLMAQEDFSGSFLSFTTYNLHDPFKANSECLNPLMSELWNLLIKTEWYGAVSNIN
jgi:hypothetical protein